MKKEIICTVCPRGCRIRVDGDREAMTSVEGHGCKRGQEYAAAEFINPVRILTTTVKMDGIDNDLLPVRSSKPIPKDKLFEVMAVIRKTVASLPVKRYDVLIADVCGTGSDIVATKSVH